MVTQAEIKETRRSERGIRSLGWPEKLWKIVSRIPTPFHTQRNDAAGIPAAHGSEMGDWFL